jgi:hypothetical protein
MFRCTLSFIERFFGSSVNLVTTLGLGLSGCSFKLDCILLWLWFSKRKSKLVFGGDLVVA